MEAKKITEAKFVSANCTANKNLIGMAYLILYDTFQVGNIFVEKDGDKFELYYPLMTFNQDNGEISHYSFIPLKAEDKEEIKNAVIEAYNQSIQDQKAAQTIE